ncbi:MAG: type IV pilus secretin PilQ [Gammaproteobacteria bacterium]
MTNGCSDNRQRAIARHITAARRCGGAWMLWPMLALLSMSVEALTLQSLEFHARSGDQTDIRLQFDAPPPAPTSYTIEQPARIVIDVPGAGSALGQKHHDLGVGNARRLSVLPAADRVRAIVSLGQLVRYQTTVDGNALLVRVGGPLSAGLESDPSIAAEAASSTSTPSEPSTAALNMPADVFGDAAEQGVGPRVTGVDFRRGEQGEGRIIVGLSDSKVPVDVSMSGGKVRVVILGTQLPGALARRLDVTDFATPVRTIDAEQLDGNTVLTLGASGEFDYLAHQADNTLSIDVSPISETRASARDEAFKYQGEKLSLNFQDIEVRSVLQLIADFTDLNLVASDTVAGRITLRLKNVPWDQALELILKTKGLDKRQVGNVLLVAPAAEIAAREKQELESQKQMSELAPLRTEFLQIRYASASQLLQLFAQASANGAAAPGPAGADPTQPVTGGMLSGRGSVIVDERTNAIIITDTQDRIDAFRAIIAQLDVAVRQVLIEARIVTASSNSSEQLGIRWGGGTSWDDGRYALSGSAEAVGEIRGGTVGGTSPGNLVVDLGATAANASGLAIGVTGESYLLDLELSALATEGTAEVVARPKVITADKSPATIRSGVEVPYQEAASSGATSTSFKDAVLSLQVTPQITPDDRIIMDLNVTQDTIGQTFNGIPSINTNAIETQVLVDNAQTVVLGGIFTVDRNQSVSKTPLLGDLPVVGRVFRRNSGRDDKQELLIFITPKIVEDTFARQR